MLNFQRFKSAFNLVQKLNFAFYLQTFVQCFAHAECIAIDIFYLLNWALSD